MYAGRALGQGGVGQNGSAEDWGGTYMLIANSATVESGAPYDDAGNARIRALVDKMGSPNASPFSHVKSRDPLFSGEDIYGIFSSDPGKQYDMTEILARGAEASEVEE